MQIVIDITNEKYEWIKRTNKQTTPLNRFCVTAIANGKPLPRGHGNLIDYDDLIAKLDRYGRKDIKYQLPYSPTIISADKEVKNNEVSD